MMFKVLFKHVYWGVCWWLGGWFPAQVHGIRFRFIYIGCKGGWPYLRKATGHNIGKRMLLNKKKQRHLQWLESRLSTWHQASQQKEYAIGAWRRTNMFSWPITSECSQGLGRRRSRHSYHPLSKCLEEIRGCECILTLFIPSILASGVTSVHPLWFCCASSASFLATVQGWMTSFNWHTQSSINGVRQPKESPRAIFGLKQYEVWWESCWGFNNFSVSK